MVLSAGVASLPPVRDFRVFLGAVILSGAWVAAITVQKYFNDWAITSSFFVLDFIYIASFYLISRPRENDAANAVKERNWAGYVVAVLTIIVAVEIAHALSTNDFALRPLALILLGAISLIILWGFARGFGYPAAIAYALLLLFINLLALNFYLVTSNVLTLIAFLIIIWRAFRGAGRNVVSWAVTLRNRRKQGAQRSK